MSCSLFENAALTKRQTPRAVNRFRDVLGLSRLAKRTGSWRTGLGNIAIRLPKTAISFLVPIHLELLLAPPLDAGITHQNVSESAPFSRVSFAIYAIAVSGAPMTCSQFVPLIGPYVAVVEWSIQRFLHESERLAWIHPGSKLCIVHSRISIVHSRTADRITEVLPL